MNNMKLLKRIKRYFCKDEYIGGLTDAHKEVVYYMVWARDEMSICADEGREKLEYDMHSRVIASEQIMDKIRGLVLEAEGRNDTHA